MATERVSLVIPGRNCARTLRQCLEAVVPLLDRTNLDEIVFVDDGSHDDTAAIASEFPVRIIPGEGKGPGAARNLGWRAAAHSLVWFVDADCVAEPDALERLLPHLEDPAVGAVSGSYGIMNDESLLACLIHEEIIERHRSMPQRVDFLATFNVLYRKEALDRVGGFDERFLKAQDAELSFRVAKAGYGLAFEFDSRVRHFHPDRWLGYLRTQRQQGYWRVFLHFCHSGHTSGDSYSSLLDHVQPPLAVLFLGTSPLLLMGLWACIPGALLMLLAAAQVPLTVALIRRVRRPGFLVFAAMGFLRAFWRGLGMAHGVVAYARSGRKRFGQVPVEVKA